MMNTILAITVAAVLAAASAQAQQQPAPSAPGGPPAPAQIPPTPAGTAAQAFMDAMNANDSAAVHAFVQRHVSATPMMEWTPARYEAMFARLARQSGGGLQPGRVMDQGDPHYLGVIFQTRSGGRVGVEFVADPADPARMKLIELHPMAPRGPRPEFPEGKADEATVAAAVARHVGAAAEADRFSGVVLLARGGRIVHHQAYGMADREAGRANTLDTRIGTGSVPKMITGVAVAQLVEQGRLKFTDTLGAVLPDYPNEDARRHVTIHHLLTHTSGVRDPFAAPGYVRGTRYATPREWMALFADQPLEIRPGERMQYSNGGYAVLAAVVERVSGQPFGEYVRDHVFRPAGMAAAQMDAYRRLPWARGYSRPPELDPMGMEPRRGNEWMVGQGGPSTELSGFGGMGLTAEDLFRFTRALREHRLLSPEMTETVLTGKVPVGSDPAVQYAYGFYVAAFPGVHAEIGHSGGGSSSGIGADVEMVGDWTLVVLGNYDLEQDIRPMAGPVLGFLARQ
ncbi:serine hydrolase domain-containing protein [Longimicrobium sp.]|uniref:serine hydrolase domain-containing protein n=1 Tax=Longimicrobium sp. TaxID=2029185 RepID=UPI003B3BDA52